MNTSIIIDDDYAELITSLKQKVSTALLNAHRAVNTELIKLHWSIGKALLARQKVNAWGSKYLEQVSRDLKLAFPGINGFSVTNLKRMRIYAEQYPRLLISAQPVHQLVWGSLLI